MNHGLADRLRANGTLKNAAFAEALLPVLCGPTGKTPAGYPYLHRYAYEHLRDRVPHLLCAGQRVLDALSLVSERTKQIELTRKEARNLTRSGKVVRQVVRTAAVTAPSDLWLLRHVLGLLSEVGLIERLLHGDVLDPRRLNVRWRGQESPAVPREADADLSFLLSRGYLEQTGEGRYFAAAHPRARAVLEAATPLASEPEGGVASLWTRLFLGEQLNDRERSCLKSISAPCVTRTDWTQDTWIATWEEVDLGSRLLPVVLGLRAAELSKLLSTSPVSATRLGTAHADLAAGALRILEAAGVLAGAGDEWVATAGAVMVVGNGFHEVRRADDERMVEVFRGYHDAGFALLFTEENALSVDDLRATAWNTYHAGFKYVHEKSGQGLRPATEGDRSTLGRPLRGSWTACATRAGYVEARDFESRSRTIYPLRRRGQPNPSISENHFLVPGPIAARLGLANAPT